MANHTRSLVDLVVALLLSGRWLHLWSAARPAAAPTRELPGGLLALCYLGGLCCWIRTAIFGKGARSRFSPVVGLVIAGTGVALRVAGQRALGSCFSWGSEPLAARLVTRGVYRKMKHPLLVGYALEVFAILVLCRSRRRARILLGGLTTLAAVWQGRREEASLARRFGVEWSEHSEGKWL